MQVPLSITPILSLKLDRRLGKKMNILNIFTSLFNLAKLTPEGSSPARRGPACSDPFATSQSFSPSPLGPGKRGAAALQHHTFCRVDAGNTPLIFLALRSCFPVRADPQRLWGLFLLHDKQQAREVWGVWDVSHCTTAGKTNLSTRFSPPAPFPPCRKSSLPPSQRRWLELCLQLPFHK